MDAVKIRIERDRYRRVGKEAKAAPHANRVELFWVTDLLGKALSELSFAHRDKTSHELMGS